jgi:hypothetical protein
MAQRNPRGVCSGKALWSHPSKKSPVLLEVTENGRALRIREDRRSFAFPCPDPDEPHVLAASAIFPDGARAEAVALSGGFGGTTDAGLTAIALSADGEENCSNVAAAFDGAARTVENAGFEVVFVLDPTAGYRTLMASGWTKGMMPTTSSTTKQFDSMVQQGSKGSEAMPKSSWKRSESSFISAEKMWFVLSNKDLQRANGFGQGKMNWLLLLFNYGSASIEGRPHIADAVAASGLVAAAGPWRRAVVLILGNHPERDGSGFTSEQAQNYLAEVGVPLFVLRNGKLRDDGWPEGVPVKNMEAFADAVEIVRSNIDSQCVTWFPGDMHPNQIAAALPDGITVAGRTGTAFEDVEAVWRQAEFSSATDDPRAEDVDEGPDTPVSGARVEVTAVNVLFSALDGEGRPVTDLEKNDLEVREDGRPVRVLGLQRIPASGTVPGETPREGAAESGAEASQSMVPIPVAIYLDRNLATSAEIQSMLTALSNRAAWLTSLGPVDVVVADRDLTTVLEGGTDAETVARSLDGLASKSAGQHAIESIRSRFLRDIRKTPQRMPTARSEEGEQGVMGELQSGQDAARLERSTVLTAARGAVFEEDAVLRHSMTRVADWALAHPGEGPRLLLVVGAGFDEDPVDFYLPFVERIETHNAAGSREEFKRYRQSDRVEQTGRDLAAAGWLVVPVASRTTGSGSTGAGVGGGDRFQQFLSAQTDAIRASNSGFLLLDPVGAQRHLAAPSGGDVVMGGDGLDRLITSSPGWYRLSYQIDRPPDGANHHFEIGSSREGVEIRSTTVVASETVEGAAEARIRRLLGHSPETGDLQVEVTTTERQPAPGKLSSAEVTVKVDLASVEPLMEEGGQRNLRVSVGIRTVGRDPFVLHRVETVEGIAPTWGYRVPLQWPEGPATVAVVVEDLGSGAWGGAVTELQ